MSKEQMIRARELILQRRFDAARAILEQIDHPTARQWLAKLDELESRRGTPSEGAGEVGAPATGEVAPATPPKETPPTPAAATAPKAQLMAARELILQKRFDAARAVLQQLDHPTARQWLAKLDELESRRGTPSEGAGEVGAPATDEVAPATPPKGTPPTPAAATAPKAQLMAARELILQKRFDAARAVLRQLDHPTARQWLARLDAMSPPAVSAPAPTATPEAGTEAPPRAVQEARLLEAQQLILDSKFDDARTVLDQLTIPEAALWRDKTQMNKFREFQSVWLDMYYYAPSASSPDTWRCGVCGRDAVQARTCPRRGQSDCPVKLRERAIQEPNRLALLLGGIHMGQTQNVKPLLSGLTVQQLHHWREVIEAQLARLWAQDIRRPTLETAAILLHQLEETRKLAGTGLGSATVARDADAVVPPKSARPAAAGTPDAHTDAEKADDETGGDDTTGDQTGAEAAEDDDGALNDALRRLGKLLGGQSSRDDD